MRTNNRTQNQNILNFLRTGKALTSDVARTRFGVKSLSKRVSEIRRTGVTITTGTKRTRNGEVTVYQLA